MTKPSSSTSRQLNFKSSRSLKLQPKCNKEQDEDIEFASGLLSKSSGLSAPNSVTSSSQKPSKRCPSHPTSNQTTTISPSRNCHQEERGAMQDNRCPHCGKAFSKRFSIPKHVQVCILFQILIYFLNIFFEGRFLIREDFLTNLVSFKIPHVFCYNIIFLGAIEANSRSHGGASLPIMYIQMFLTERIE